MKRKGSKNLSSFILCMALTVAMALFTTGCNDKSDKMASQSTDAAGNTQGSPVGAEADTGEADTQGEGNVLGEGSRIFSLTVTDQDGTESRYEVHTDKETVGDALQELGVIQGEESEYGLYVKTVNGLTLDYDKDGKYWAFYVNGEYASAGVDATAITEGDSYSFKAE